MKTVIVSCTMPSNVVVRVKRGSVLKSAESLFDKIFEGPNSLFGRTFGEGKKTAPTITEEASSTQPFELSLTVPSGAEIAVAKILQTMARELTSP